MSIIQLYKLEKVSLKFPSTTIKNSTMRRRSTLVNPLDLLPVKTKTRAQKGLPQKDCSEQLLWESMSPNITVVRRIAFNDETFQYIET
ncbi:hypothetical protein CEXT_214301 [Caerostris extrusa]|uniref:Uncharacterized protein n=1 Tax=Caerostris extrusa TaxID=172846 RepID=A0AAV4N6N6_CAEEX|nr:hypothetical protein CEXT_214301 [Caerostris extrusa]